MAVTEIDEVELQRLRQLEGTVNVLLKHPKARRKILEAQKEQNPNISIPELDANRPVEEEIHKLRNELAADKQARSAEKEQEKVDKSREHLNAKFEEGRQLALSAGYTNDGLKTLEDYMQANGIFSHRIGMAAFERDNPQAQPIASSTSWNFFEQPEGNGKELMDKMVESHGEDDAILRKLTHQALADTRSGQRR